MIPLVLSLDYDHSGIFATELFSEHWSASVRLTRWRPSQSLHGVSLGSGSNYRGGWQHVAMTFDGTSKVITLYLNGVEVSYSDAYDRSRYAR
jgi:hypothetical protein